MLRTAFRGSHLTTNGKRPVCPRLSNQSSGDEDEFLATPQRWNKYAYVLNNPLNHTDPNGDEIPVWERRLEGGPPTDANTALSEALLVGGVGAAASAGGAGVLARAAAYGRGLITAAVGYFLTPQGQQTATNLAEAIAPPGSNIGLGRTFGFTSIGGQIEGFTYGRFANGAEVAANFSRNGGNVTASILGAFNPEGAKGAGTLNAILQGAQAVAKEQGATSLTIQAVAVTNPKLAGLLVKQGFTETSIKVGKETVKTLVKTIKVQ